MNQLQTILQSARIPFLVLAPISVFVGVSAAYASGADILPVHVALTILAAVLAHISVNAFNEYMDYRSGLDLKTERTPFSGGSGGLVQNPSALNAVLGFAWFTLLLTISIGLYFVMLRGTELAWFGAAGVLLVLGYTPWINRLPLVCWAAPGLGFGPVIVIGTYLSLTGDISMVAIVSSIIPFMLANNLLLLNQFPDIDADRSVGRRHIPIVLGKVAGLAIYSLGVLIAAAAVVLGCLIGLFPWLTMATLVPLAVAVTVVLGLKPLLRKAPSLWIPFLGRNVIITLVTPLLFGMTLLFG